MTSALTLLVLRPENPAYALGLAVNYLMTSPAFTRQPFGHWARVLAGQIGNDLDNYLIGNGGADILQGGLGDDVYAVWGATSTIIEDPNGGHDKLWVLLEDSASLTIPDNVEEMFILSQLDGVQATGNGGSADETISGVASDLRLRGREGDDTLSGNGDSDGNDKLYGGDGADELIGGRDNDYLHGSIGRDILRGGLDKDVLTAGTVATPSISTRSRTASRARSATSLEISSVSANASISATSTPRRASMAIRVQLHRQKGLFR